MRRSYCHEDQIHIFPTEVMVQIAGHPKAPAPLPELPIAEKDEIDTSRACRILGVGSRAILTLVEAGLITCMRKQERGLRFFSYASIVAFCDQLRIVNAIPDRRKPRRKPTDRYPDDEILPFPISDTVDIPEVATHLRLSEQSVRKLCEDGTLVSYKLHPTHPWRISRTSLAAHMERIRSGEFK